MKLEMDIYMVEDSFAGERFSYFRATPINTQMDGKFMGRYVGELSSNRRYFTFGNATIEILYNEDTVYNIYSTLEEDITVASHPRYHWDIEGNFIRSASGFIAEREGENSVFVSEAGINEIMIPKE